MNRQCSSNTSINLINWDVNIEEPKLPKSNSLVEMFDPIFDTSSRMNSQQDLDVNNQEIFNSTSSEDIFAPVSINKSKLYPDISQDDFFSDMGIDRSERVSMIYPSLNSFKSIYTDDRYSVFEPHDQSANKSLCEENSFDLRGSIFKEVSKEMMTQSIFVDECADRDMDRLMKTLKDYHEQALILRNDDRSHLIFNRILPQQYGELSQLNDDLDVGLTNSIPLSTHGDVTNSLHCFSNRCSVVIKVNRLHNPNHGYGNEDFCYTTNIDPYSINERELILEVTEKFDIVMDFSHLYLRIKGQSEYLKQSEFPFIRNSYVFECVRMKADVHLVLEYIDIKSDSKYRVDYIEDINKFIYSNLEHNFHWFPREQVEVSYNNIIFYRNMIVGDLKEYNTFNLDIANIEASIGVFKNKCRSLCILMNDIYTHSVAVKFLELDNVTQSILTQYLSGEQISANLVSHLISCVDSSSKLMLGLIHKFTVLCNTSFRLRSEMLSTAGLLCSNTGAQSTKKYRSVFTTRLGAVCKIPKSFHINYNSYEVKLCLRVGKQRLSHYLSSRSKIEDSLVTTASSLNVTHPDFSESINFDQLVAFNNVCVNILPADTSLRILLIGRKVTSSGDSHVTNKEIVAWSELGLFDSRGYLKQSSLLMGLFLGAPNSEQYWSCGQNYCRDAMIIEIELPSFHVPVKYHYESTASSIHLDMDLSSPELIRNRKNEIDRNILDIWLDQYHNSGTNNESKSSSIPNGKKTRHNQYPYQMKSRCDMLYCNRHLLLEHPPWYMGLCLAVLSYGQTTSDFDVTDCSLLPYSSCDWLYDYLELCRRDISTPATINSLMQMIGPLMPLTRLREWTIQGLLAAGPDCCIGLLPWLIEALKYDMNIGASGLESLLIDFSLRNINFATALFWNLSAISHQEVHGYRVTLLLSMLHVVMNSAVKNMWAHQLTVVEHLQTTASAVKLFKGSVTDRKGTLMRHLEELYDKIFEGNLPTNQIGLHPLANFRIPYQPGFHLTKLEMKDCSYFNSFTLPLRIVFGGLDQKNVEVMFKHGDDLRQDILVLQMLQLMDEVWSSNGLDLHSVHYKVMPTGEVAGLIELVGDCSTLRKVQELRGGIAAPLTSASVISDWLKAHCSSRGDYQARIVNFLLSCAGCCVATFLLGIGDRHNDNIMLQTNGRLFHIDFAKILGDAQTFAGIKRDRVPFVLTQDMVYVLDELNTNELMKSNSLPTNNNNMKRNSRCVGGGNDDPRTGMQIFIDKCCEAYNIIRHNWSSILAVLTMAADSGIPGVNHKTIFYVIDKLRLDLTDVQASEYFTDLIRKCVSSISTPVNFVIHNLAQMKYSSNNEGNLFSFTPKIYSNDPVILDISIKCVKRVRQPNKHYVYQITVHKSETDAAMAISTVYRRYEHFMELAQHLMNLFPLSCLPKLCQTIINLGAPNSITAAESKRATIQQFVVTILSQELEISHCPEIQTFFHPILSDEQTTEDDQSIYLSPDNNNKLSPQMLQQRPEIQLAINMDDGLEIFVKHARNLSLGKSCDPPNSYVKTYLVPHLGNSTKRKTGVIPHSSAPSFNDIIRYDKADLINVKSIKVSVWHSETFGENICLGHVCVPINSESQNLLTEHKETWYKLLPTNFSSVDGNNSSGGNTVLERALTMSSSPSIRRKHSSISLKKHSSAAYNQYV